MIKSFRTVIQYSLQKNKDSDQKHLKEIWNRIVNLKDLTDLFEKYADLLF